MIMKNTSACTSVSSFEISSELYDLGVVSDYMIIRALPVMRRQIAGRSYFQKKTSFRQHIASHALTMIAEAEFAVRRVMSAKGRTPTLGVSVNEKLLTCMNHCSNE